MEITMSVEMRCEGGVEMRCEGGVEMRCITYPLLQSQDVPSLYLHESVSLCVAFLHPHPTTCIFSNVSYISAKLAWATCTL